MTNPRLAVGAIAVTVLLSGCSAPAAPADEPSPSPTVVAPKPTEPVEDDMAACALVGETLLPSADIIAAMVEDPTGGTLNTAMVTVTAFKLRKMLDLGTPQMDAYAAAYAMPVLLLDDILEGKSSGNQSVDTGAYRDSVPDLLAYCVDDVGYSIER